MSSSHRPSRLLAIPLVLLLVAVAAFGYWRSVSSQLPEGLSMANGRLEATEVQIASKTPGRLAEVLVNEGDRVSKDQLLARLDTRTLEASRTQAEAEVLRAKQTLAAAEATVTGAEAGSAARIRLDAVAASTDGFELSKLDIELRREGDVLGARQSGVRSSLRLLSVVRDVDIIADAREAALVVIESGEIPADLAASMARLEESERADYLERT